MRIPSPQRAHVVRLALAALVTALAACHPGQSNGHGGGPYVWVCTPANMSANVGSNTSADLYVFNGSASAANVSVNILDRDGNNLAGHNIPGTNPAMNYPGQTGSATVGVDPAHTLNLHWMTPMMASPQSNGVTDVSYSVRVTSDQPVVVSTNFWWNGPAPLPCSLLPK